MTDLSVTADEQPPTPLTVAISSRALFDLGESNEIYDNAGLEAYRRYQIAHEDDPQRAVLA